MSRRLSISLRAAGVRRGARWALEPVTLQLHAGERWALTGDNGSGKTHLLKLLSADLWPTPTGRESRIYRLGGQRIEEMQARELVAYLGAETQDKYVRHDWNFPVREILTAGVQGTDIVLAPADRAVRARVRRLLRECSLSHLAARRFLTLSNGQRRLVLLARSLARRPHWLLLDEPYNGLDAPNRRRLDAILARARRRGQAWVISAHRIEDIPAGTLRQASLVAGRLVRRGKIRRTAITREGSDPAAPVRSPLRTTSPGTTLISVRGADLYVDYHCVLRRLDWDLRRGEHWAITGINGAGKSSFLRMLYGDLAPAHGGTIRRAGFVTGTPIEAWKQTVGHVSPELQAEYGIDVSVLDLVVSGRYASIGLNEPATDADRSVALRWLENFGIGDLAARRPREMSYGQLRRALLARAFAGAPRLLLLDEPFSGLDAHHRALLRELLSRLMARGITLVMAVHHIGDLPAGITHVLRLHKRRAYPQVLKVANPV